MKQQHGVSVRQLGLQILPPLLQLAILHSSTSFRVTFLEHLLIGPPKHSDAGDLEQLSQLGHFLKGSAATLGLIKVRDGCEHIQRYGKRENLDGSDEPDTQLNLKRIENALVQVQEDYKEVESVLRDYYDKVENDERA